MRTSEQDDGMRDRDGDERLGVHRRGFLQASAATVSLAGIAGAGVATRFGSSGMQAAAIPDYADWVPADDAFLRDDGTVFVAGLDVTAFLEFLASDAQDDGGDDDESEAQPFPLESVIQPFLSIIFDASFLEQLGLASPIVGQSLNADNPEDIETDAPADQFVAMGDTTVYLGSFDTDAITSAAESAGLTDEGDGVYTNDQGSVALAWDSEWVVTSSDPELVRTTIAAGTGQETRRYEVSDDFGELLSRAGQGDFVSAQLAREPTLTFSETDGDFFNIDYSAIQETGIQGYAQSSVYDTNERRIDTTLTVSYESEDSVDTDALAAVGAEASQRSSSRDGRFVTLQFRYTESDFISGGGTDDGTDDGTDNGTDNGTDDGTDNGSTDDSTDGGTNDEMDDETSDEEEESSDDDGPGFGVAATVTALGGAGYMVSRRLGNEE